MTRLEIMVQYAMSFVGVPYKWAGSNPMAGFDCSGFVQEVLASVGADPAGDQSAQGLYDTFKANDLRMLRPPETGDLLFYGRSTREITHITLCIGQGLSIGANGGGSKTTNLENAIHGDAFIKIRPHDYRKDLVAVVNPFIKTHPILP